MGNSLKIWKKVFFVYLAFFFLVFLSCLVFTKNVESSFYLGLFSLLAGFPLIASHYKGIARGAKQKKTIDEQALYYAVRESFEHHAPSWADILAIINYVSREEYYEAKPDEIKPIIERLLEEGFIVKYSGGWQLASETSSSQRSVNSQTG